MIFVCMCNKCKIPVKILFICLYSVVSNVSYNYMARCSGHYHRIVNSLDKHGYESELRMALNSAKPLVVKHLRTCIAIGGPEVMLQSQNSRYSSTIVCLCQSSLLCIMILRPRVFVLR